MRLSRTPYEERNKLQSQARNLHTETHTGAADFMDGGAKSRVWRKISAELETSRGLRYIYAYDSSDRIWLSDNLYRAYWISWFINYVEFN